MLDTAAGELVKSGILGAIIVILFVAIAYLFKLLMKEKDKYTDLLRETLQREGGYIETLKQALEFVKDASK